MRKSELDKLSSSYARKLSATNDASTSALTSRAKDSLASVNNVYQAAADATDVLRTLLAAADLSPKDLLQLTSSLKSISSVLVESRAEARTTVAELSRAEAPAEAAAHVGDGVSAAPPLDPPAPSGVAAIHAVHAQLTNFALEANQGREFTYTSKETK